MQLLCMSASTTRITVLWRPLKMRISFLCVFQKCASRFMKVIQNCISFVWALQQCATRFYEGLKNVHLLVSVFQKLASQFMKVAKTAAPLYGASIMRIMVLWRPFTTRISFLWGFQKFDSRFMKVWTICISFDERRKKLCITIYGRA